MVFLLDKQKKPLPMIAESEARVLLKNGDAVIHRRFPFVIRLKADSYQPKEIAYTLKIDPGSKYTGLALVSSKGAVTFLATLEHRGDAIHLKMEKRAQTRRNRRTRETRYRKPKWGNAKKKKDSKFSTDSPRPNGWLPPSEQSILDNICTWIDRLMSWCPVSEIVIESVGIDSQKMDNPDIEGVEYQQGTLAGYEIRDYLMETYQYTCQYCGGKSGDLRMEVEHKTPKSRGGSNKISNLTLSCHTCNQAKGNLTPGEWKAKIEKDASKKRSKKASDLEVARLKGIQNVIDGKKTGQSNRYSTWVSAYRWQLYWHAVSKEIQVSLSPGYKTQFNRTVIAKLPKEHCYDALCVKDVPENLSFRCLEILTVKACGRGSHFRGRTNACGIIKSNCMRTKKVHGFQTGDIVRADVPKPLKKAGTYVGKVAVRKSGSFNITDSRGTVQGIGHQYVRLLQPVDGYSYTSARRTDF